MEGGDRRNTTQKERGFNLKSFWKPKNLLTNKIAFAMMKLILKSLELVVSRMACLQLKAFLVN